MAVKTGRELALFGFYLLVAIVLTWPLTANLTTTVSDLGDPLLNTWILDWDCYALTHQPLHLFDAPIFYPAKFPLAYSENLVGIAILCLPFYAIGFAPLTIYNIALLLGFTLSAYGASVLGRVITRRLVPSALAGLLYGFVPYRFGHLAHLQVISAAWLPLLLAALLVYRRSPTMRNATLFGAAFVMNGLTNVYFFLFGSVAVLLTIALMAIAESRNRRFWLQLAGSLLIACAVLLPFFIPYQIVSTRYEMKRGEGESLGASATLNDWLIAPRQSAIYGHIREQNERMLFPGALMILFTAAAFLAIRPLTPASPVPLPRERDLKWLDAIIVLLTIATFVISSRSQVPATLLFVCIIARIVIRFPRAISHGNLRSAIAQSRFPFELWAAGLWIVVGVVGSLGLHAFFHSFLFHKVLPFRAIRVPARWAMIAYTGLVGWTAAGAALVRARWMFPVLFTLALVDVWPNIRWEHALVDPAPVDRWLAQTHAGPLIELPIHRLDALYIDLLHATNHHVPIFDGISGFEPPLHRLLREQPLSDSTFDVLERNGCRFVLAHPDWYPPIRDWLRRGLQTGRLVFLRRFDAAGVSGDWLFALPRVEKNWQRYYVPEKEDQLALFLDGKPTINGSTFGRLFEPKHLSTITGTMTVSGWALSPDGIRAVNILLEDGTVRIPAGLFAREDVTRAFPWYPRTTKPVFAAVIPQRPGDVPEETDLQIEIIDGAGKKTLLPDVLLTWRAAGGGQRAGPPAR